MGAWGTGPFDNDTAGDFMDGCEHALANKVHEAARAVAWPESLHIEGRAALAALRALHRAGLTISLDVFTEGEELLEEMLTDKRWIAAWRSPTAYTRRLRKELDETRALVRSMRRRYRGRRRRGQ